MTSTRRRGSPARQDPGRQDPGRQDPGRQDPGRREADPSAAADDPDQPRSGDQRWDPATQIVVEHNSPVPLYHQVASQIEAAIEAESLPVGTRLDNEIDLAARLNLSRPTIRQAIGSLVDKGLVVRKRGAGTQVVFNQVKRSLELSSLFDDLVRFDRHPYTRVLLNAVEPASAEVAGKLGIAENDDVLRLERVRFASGEPIALMHNRLPADLLDVPTESFVEQGLYQLLRTAGVRLHAARQTISARTANREDAELLDESEGAPLLAMERVTYDQRGRVVEHGSHAYRASRYSFDLSLRGDI